jgi:hypothetical protein
VAYAMREKRCAYTRRKYRGFLHFGPEDAKFLEAAHQNTVAKELYRIPVQFRLEHFEGGLGGIGAGFEGTWGSKTYRLHLEDKLIDRAGLGSKFTPVTHRHRPCNYNAHQEVETEHFGIWKQTIGRIIIPFAARINEQDLWK